MTPTEYALHIVSRMRDELTIIERRLTRTGSTVEPEPEDADHLVNMSRELRQALGEL